MMSHKDKSKISNERAGSLFLDIQMTKFNFVTRKK